MDQPLLHDRFASYVATLGRGPGRSRALTRAEARDAFSMVLRGEADPLQVGAFLMLLRYRGEDPEEITGLVEAGRYIMGLGRQRLAAALPEVELDWPSYGAGRTRTAPWFLLAALALARSGVRTLMHGSNEFGTGISVPDGLASLGLSPCRTADDVARALETGRFAYWPASCMAPALERLLALRRLFGLRSPVNTVCRLLDPADAAASVDGVFHPPYIALHLGVAARLQRPSLLVVKGGGGEAERSGAKPVVAHLHRNGAPVREIVLPARFAAARDVRDAPSVAPDTVALEAVWRGEAPEALAAVETVKGTIAMALLALGRSDDAAHADAAADAVWEQRHRG